MRDPKPWYRKSSKAWYAQIGGRQVRLGETERAAKTKLKELLKRPEQVTSEPLKVLFDRYLAYCEQNLAKDTFEKNYYHLKRFSAKIGNLKAGSLKPFHVQRIIDGPSDDGGYAKRPKAVLGKLLSDDDSGVEFKAVAAAGGEFGAAFLVWDGEGWGELFCGTQEARPLTKQLAASLKDALPVTLANGRAVRYGVDIQRPSEEEISRQVARFLA